MHARLAIRCALVPLALYASWLGMMAVHELGHVLHARLSGGDVRAVRVPLVGFSVTEFDANPRPSLVAWGGAVWGSVLPLAVWSIAHAVRSRGRGAVQFFAGFCLVANGAYLGVGWAVPSGDARDLIDLGTPRWLLILFGGVAVAAGLWLWHGLGPVVPRGTKKGGPDRPAP